jgi:hypothetical protein
MFSLLMSLVYRVCHDIFCWWIAQVGAVVSIASGAFWQPLPVGASRGQKGDGFAAIGCVTYARFCLFDSVNQVGDF